MEGLEQLILFAVSLVANLFSAFAGGGAGLIQLPALIFLGLPFSVALATHKVASAALGIGATTRHLSKRRLEVSFALFILGTGIPGVILGASLILAVPEHIGRIALGALTIALGLYSRLRPQLGLEEMTRHRDRAGYAVGGIGLFFIGVLNGSLTSGTGLFVTLWQWAGLGWTTSAR